MGNRGPKPGSGGRPKKPVSEKVMEGNPGKRELKELKIKPQPQVKKMPKYLQQCGKEDDGTLPDAKEIYFCLAEFIKAAGCENHIAPPLIEDFTHLRRSFIECEYMNRKMGRIANGKRSPYVSMAVEYSKQSLAVYDRIWNIISQHGEQPLEGKNAFLQLLTNRGF